MVEILLLIVSIIKCSIVIGSITITYNDDNGD